MSLSVAWQVEYRAEKEGLIQVPIGKASFSQTALLDNLKYAHYFLEFLDVSLQTRYNTCIIIYSDL